MAAGAPVLPVPPDLPIPPILPVLPILPFHLSSVIGFFSSAVFGGFGGRGRLMLRLTPFQNVSSLRSTSWFPRTRYSRTALSHCRPALATSFIQSPRAVSSGASVEPSQMVTFG